jgi:hypothetical protein
MKNLVFALTLFLCPLAMATMPTGIWLNKNLVADDGGYGKYYQGWLFISDNNIDQLTTLGAHYDKVKFSIVSDNGKSVRLFDPEEVETKDFTYELNENTLNLCSSEDACIAYERTNEKPMTDDPPRSFPKIRLSAKWCVDQDCETIQYSENQSEFLYNLNSSFKTTYWQYVAPESLMQKYALKMNALVYSYRLDNSGKLSSYSTLAYLQTGDANTIAKSGVVRLKEGLLTTVGGNFENKNISVEFYLELPSN